MVSTEKIANDLMCERGTLYSSRKQFPMAAQPAPVVPAVWRAVAKRPQVDASSDHVVGGELAPAHPGRGVERPHATRLDPYPGGQ